MPVKARMPKPLKTTITEEMLELFARGLQIIAEGADEEWEGAEVVGLGGEPQPHQRGGGRRREFSDLDVGLHTLLRRKPWQASVFDVDLDLVGAPDHWRSPSHDYAGAKAARHQLQAALDAQRRGQAVARTKRKAAPADDAEPPRP